MTRFIAALALVGILLSLVLQFNGSALSPYHLYPLFVVLGLGGGILVCQLGMNFIRLEFGSDLLAGLSIVTAVILEEYLAGSLVVLMLSGGAALESFAVRKASRVLEALAKRSPTIAHRKREGVLEDIGVEQIAIGDILEIFPHEICPVDGEVLRGNGVMDESYLTGEPFLISKAPGARVISGAINGDGALEIRATKRAQDSQYAKVIEVMKETEQKRPKIRRLADQLGAWYTPLAILIALAAWFASGEAIRFLSVLVIATPCPLLIAIPVAIIGSISLSARQGILIKNPAVLEQITLCKTMIFDKTGTLTYGSPVLVEQKLYGGNLQGDVLKLSASLERYSKHPLAEAILSEAKKEQIALANAEKVNEPKGEGLFGIVEGRQVVITSRKRLHETLKQQLISPDAGGLECFILIDNALAAHYRFHDAPRKESRLFISHLSKYHQISKVMIVSGDRQEEVNYLASEVGIDLVYAGQTPKDKVEIVLKEVKKAKTAYLGDGINDAPALVAATVGIAFGRNSDVTAEAAGAVIMESSLQRVDEFLHIGKRMRSIALQSAIGGMCFSIIGMGFAAFGFLPPVAGAIGQEAIDVIAILNALRTLVKPRYLSEKSWRD